MTRPSDRFGVPFRLDHDLQQAMAGLEHTYAAIGRELRNACAELPAEHHQLFFRKAGFSKREAAALLEFSALYDAAPTTESARRMRRLRDTTLFELMARLAARAMEGRDGA